MLNLDKIVREDVKFILKGKEYVIPGEVSVEQRLTIAKHAQNFMKSNDMANIGKIADAFLDVIEPANPGMDRKKFKSIITMDQLNVLFRALDGNIVEQKDETEGAEKNGSGADLTQ